MAYYYSPSCEKEYERLLDARSRRYESTNERLRLYRKAVELLCEGDKEKIKQTLAKVGF
jgi:hypothetical protein